MAQVIKMQAYKDWKSGLITTEELLEGKTYFPENLTFGTGELLSFDPAIAVRRMDNLFSQVFDPSPIDWMNMPHHEHCCCNECAPTKEDRDRIAKDFYKCGDDCICVECVNRRMHEEYKKHHNLAPSDCEE